MTERLDAPTADAASGRESPNGTDRAAGYTPLPLSARGFSAIMHREAGLRAPVRPPRQSAAFNAVDLPGAALDLPPPLRLAVAALLRGDYVSPDERLALARAVSLLSAKDDVPAASLRESFGSPANSNCAASGRSVKAVVPPLPNLFGPGSDNPVLRDLLLEPVDQDDV